jgi:hypothetical protein
MPMRIINPNSLASLAASRGRAPRPAGRSADRPTLRQRVNAYTLWAFNPQRELTTRYDRAA